MRTWDWFPVNHIFLYLRFLALTAAFLILLHLFLHGQLASIYFLRHSKASHAKLKEGLSLSLDYQPLLAQIMIGIVKAAKFCQNHFSVVRNAVLLKQTWKEICNSNICPKKGGGIFCQNVFFKMKNAVSLMSGWDSAIGTKLMFLVSRGRTKIPQVKYFWKKKLSLAPWPGRKSYSAAFPEWILRFFPGPPTSCPKNRRRRWIAPRRPRAPRRAVSWWSHPSFGSCSPGC